VIAVFWLYAPGSQSVCQIFVGEDFAPDEELSADAGPGLRRELFRRCRHRVSAAAAGVSGFPGRCRNEFAK